MKPSRLLFALAVLASCGSALAQTAPAAPAPAHDGHASHAAAPATSDSPATAAYRAAAQRMHAAMDIPYTGNADVDFMRGMIAHHQGAIDMSEVVLKYGSDPQVRALAQQVIAAQQEEIKMMKAWLAARGY